MTKQTNSIRKIDGQRTIEGFTAKVRLSNRAVERAVERLRGNARVIAKRLLYDYRNAANSGRKKPPCLHSHNGKACLRTSPALIVAAEDYSFTAQTCRNNLRRLEERGTVVERIVNIGNDLLIFLDGELLEWYEPKTSPQEPPELQGSARHIEAQEEGISNASIVALAKKFNRKHHG